MFLVLKSISKIDSLHFKHLNDSLSTVIRTLEKEDLTIKYINSVGAQWPFLLVVFAILFLFFYRKKMEMFLSKTKSFKGAAAGVSVELIQNENTININTQTEELASDNISLPSDLKEKNKEEDIENRSPVIFDIYTELNKGNYEAATAVFEKIQQKTTDLLDIEKNKLVFQYFKYVNGHTDSIGQINQIRDLSSNTEIKSTSDYYIALCYTYSQNYKKAIEFGLKAIELAKKDVVNDLLVKYLLGISDAFLKSDKRQEYLKLLFSEINATFNDEELFKVYKKIASVYYDNKMYLEALTCFLTANNLISNDTDILFNIGYCASQLEYNEISLQFYQLGNRLKADNSATENNLAVAYDRLQIKSKAIEFYKKSNKNGSSLAGSNLANIYINSGFWDEAKDVLNDIKSNNTDIHPNIWKSYDKLDEDAKNESGKLDNIYKNSLLMKSFFEHYKSAMTFHVLNGGVFELANYVLDDNKYAVESDTLNRTLIVDLNNSNLSILFPKHFEIIGQCTGIDYYKPGQSFKNESYKGLYYVVDGNIRVMLKYDYYTLRQEMLFFTFVKRELPIIENL